MKQTAVDHLFERFNMLFLFSEAIPDELQEAYDQAKQIEKEQLKDAYSNGVVRHLHSKTILSEEYYNETYGNND